MEIRDTHVNEFIGVWQSSQPLQLNCQLNVKITNHSNAMKFKTAASIAVVVTPLLQLQYWMTKWRTFICSKKELNKVYSSSSLSSSSITATLKRFNKCIFMIKFHLLQIFRNPLWSACITCCCIFTFHVFVMIDVQMRAQKIDWKSMEASLLWMEYMNSNITWQTCAFFANIWLNHRFFVRWIFHEKIILLQISLPLASWWVLANHNKIYFEKISI